MTRWLVLDSQGNYPARSLGAKTFYEAQFTLDSCPS